MAGFIVNNQKNEDQFHSDSEFHFGMGSGLTIVRKTHGARVITLQLDGDELAAALWGLDHYKKGS